MEQTQSPGLDRAWAAAATGLAGAVLSITSGVRTPGGMIAAVSVLLLGALAVVEARRPASVPSFVRVVPYVVLVIGAALIISGRM